MALRAGFITDAGWAPVVSFIGIALTTAALAQEQTYRLDVEISWSAQTHPLEFPQNAHTSGLIGATHNGRYVLFADGRTASSGVELVAENGRSSILRAELDEAARRGRVGTVFTADGLATVPGTMTARFTATADHPLVSFVTMIAPSPDWFTGVGGIDLRPGGEWIEGVSVTLWAWDAGTDGGATYAAENDDTQPAQSTRLLATRHVLQDGGLRSVGRARISKAQPEP